MLVKFNGLPMHVLLVHVVVIVVPAAAAALVASAAWPAARRWLGLATPLLATVALGSVPLTTHAGEWLRGQIPNTRLVDKHAEMGDGLNLWVILLFVLACAVWALHAEGPALLTRLTDPIVKAIVRTDSQRRIWSIALTAGAVIAAIGAVVMVYRIGDSGARAAWSDRIS